MKTNLATRYQLAGKIGALTLSVSLALAACGSSSDSAAETSAPAETVASEPAATEAPAVTEAPAAATSAGNLYELKEWSLEGSPTLATGSVELTVKNGGEFPHEFKIFKGSYETLPKNELGTVTEAELAADAKLAAIEKIAPGTESKVTVDLPAGTYLFVCNIEFGPNSHAGKGQVLDVTVA
jgi:uncharacterized cupredoxin-like copper-binding protein